MEEKLPQDATSIPLGHAQRVMLEDVQRNRGRLESLAHQYGGPDHAVGCVKFLRGLPAEVQERLNNYADIVTPAHATADERRLHFLMLLVQMGELMPISDKPRKRSRTPWEVLTELQEKNPTAMTLLLAPVEQNSAS